MIVFLNLSTFYANCNNPIEPGLHNKYVENFFSFQGEFGNRFSLSGKYIKDNIGCTKIFYDFDSTINYYEFYNACSRNILNSYYDYVDYHMKEDNNMNRDSLQKEIIERVKRCVEFKQCFYSFFCQFYQFDIDTLFGIEIIKKDTIALDSLENLALLSFTIDGVDSVNGSLVSHFCAGAGNKSIKDISTNIVYHDVASIIHTEEISNVWHETLSLINADTKARIIDGTKLEDIRKQAEQQLRKEIKKSGLLSKAIKESYLESNFKPYVIK